MSGSGYPEPRCDCQSYNRPHQGGTKPEVLLTPPPEIAAMRSDPDAGICVDACIADVVQAVWDTGFITLGSCCGHGKRRPSLVMSQDPVDVVELRAVIALVDDREFELLQWQLVELEGEQ